MDYGINLKFSNNDIADGLEKTAAGFDQLVEATAEFEKGSKKASQSAAKDLMAVQSETKKTVNELQKAGQAIEETFREKQADIASVAFAIAKNSKASEQLAAMLKKIEQAKLNGVVLDVQAMEEEFTNLLQNVELTDEEIKILAANIGDVASEIQKINSDELKDTAEDTNVLTKEFKSAKAELRALTSAINSGDLSGAELEQAKQRAGELTDKIGDTKNQIKALASDSRAFDTLVEGTRAVTAGFAIAQGTAELFGDESEDLQKAMVKLNAIMAISQGLQEAQNLLQKENALVTNLSAAAQKVYAFAVGSSSGALKAFRLALIGTGIGAVIVLVGALIANWDKISIVKELINQMNKELKSRDKLTTMERLEYRRLFNDKIGIYKCIMN